MKILHIIPLLHGGGAEKFCIDLCNELSKEHDVTICALFDVEEHMFMAKALTPDVNVITLNKKIGFDPRIFFKIYTLVKNGDYDVINTHLMGLFNSMPAVVLTKNKIFHTVHNMANEETRKIPRVIYKLLFQFSKVTPIGISKKVVESIHKEYGSRFNVLIDNGTKQLDATEQLENVYREIQNYKKTIDTKIFLTIGRISHQKNHEMLIHVFNRLLCENEDVVLLIIGKDNELGDPLLKQLQQIAKPGIHFLGMKLNISDYLLCCDAFCLSSLYEGLPITLLEAMSLGVIPICTPAGGIVDVLHDMENGLLSTDFSSDAYYAKIKEFLSLTPSEKTTLQNQALKDFKHSFNISATAAKYTNLYRETT